MKRVYIIGSPQIDADEFEAERAALTDAGYDVANRLDNTHLRLRVVELASADSIVLLPGWWTTNDGNCLQHLAAWLHLPILNKVNA